MKNNFWGGVGILLIVSASGFLFWGMSSQSASERADAYTHGVEDGVSGMPVEADPYVYRHQRDQWRRGWAEGWRKAHKKRTDR